MVDLPTATEPGDADHERGAADVLAQERAGGGVQPAGRLDVQVEQPRDRPVDGVDLGQVDRVPEAGQALDVGVGERQRGGGGEPRPGVAVEVDVGRRRCGGRAARARAPSVAASTVVGAPKPTRTARTPASNSARAAAVGATLPGSACRISVMTQPCTWDQMLRAIVSVSPDQLAAVDGVLRPGDVVVEREAAALRGGVGGVGGGDARGEHHRVLERVRQRPVAVGVGAAEQPVDAVERVDRRQGLVEAGERLHDRRVDERRLAAEVRVHADGRAARQRGDPAHGEGGRPLGAEDLDGLGQDPVAQGRR